MELKRCIYTYKINYLVYIPIKPYKPTYILPNHTFVPIVFHHTNIVRMNRSEANFSLSANFSTVDNKFMKL